MGYYLAKTALFQNSVTHSNHNAAKCRAINGDGWLDIVLYNLGSVEVGHTCLMDISLGAKT